MGSAWTSTPRAPDGGSPRPRRREESDPHAAVRGVAASWMQVTSMRFDMRSDQLDPGAGLRSSGQTSGRRTERRRSGSPFGRGTGSDGQKPQDEAEADRSGPSDDGDRFRPIPADPAHLCPLPSFPSPGVDRTASVPSQHRSSRYPGMSGLPQNRSGSVGRRSTNRFTSPSLCSSKAS